MPPAKDKCHDFHFPSFIRWLILIIIFLIGLYFVLPKYELMSPKYRFNKVTGKVEHYFQEAGKDLVPPPAK